MGVRGVDVAPHRSFKENGLLRNDPESGPEIVKTQSRNIDSVDDDLSPGGLHQAEQRLDQRRFSASGPADDSDLLSSVDPECDSFQNHRGIETIPHLRQFSVDYFSSSKYPHGTVVENSR